MPPAGIDVEGWEDVAPSASFEVAKVSGSTGCNRYGAPLTLDGDMLELGAIAVTRMACPPPAGDVETAFVAALERVARWQVEGDVLTLRDADDSELLEFEAAMPVGSWLATSILRGDALTSPIAGTEITALFAESGEVSGDAGCNTYLGEYATDLGAIQISPSTTTEKSCAEPQGVMEQEAAYLDALESAVSYRVDGRVLELADADRERVVQFTRR